MLNALLDVSLDEGLLVDELADLGQVSAHLGNGIGELGLHWLRVVSAEDLVHGLVLLAPSRLLVAIAADVYRQLNGPVVNSPFLLEKAACFVARTQVMFRCALLRWVPPSGL